MNLVQSFVKTITLICLVCMTSSSLLAQSTGVKNTSQSKLSPYGPIETSWYKLGWFLEGNFGTRLLGATSESVDMSPGFNTNLSLGIFTSDRLGFKGRYDFNTFKFTPGFNNQDNSIGRMHSVSFEVLTDILPLVGVTKFRDWRIILHGGAGLSTYRNVDYADYREEIWSWDDPGIKGNDDMIHAIVGITPQYHINGRWSLNLDISSFFLFKQDLTFDRFSIEPKTGVGNIMTASLGATLRL